MERFKAVKMGLFAVAMCGFATGANAMTAYRVGGGWAWVCGGAAVMMALLGLALAAGVYRILDQIEEETADIRHLLFHHIRGKECK